LIASYNLQPGNRAGLFSKEKISKEKSEEKRISGQVYDVNKQTIYIALKSTNESRAQYSLEPAWVTISLACRRVKILYHYLKWLSSGTSERRR